MQESMAGGSSALRGTLVGARQPVFARTGAHLPMVAAAVLATLTVLALAVLGAAVPALAVLALRVLAPLPFADAMRLRSGLLGLRRGKKRIRAGDARHRRGRRSEREGEGESEEEGFDEVHRNLQSGSVVSGSGQDLQHGAGQRENPDFPDEMAWLRIHSRQRVSAGYASRSKRPLHDPRGGDAIIQVVTGSRVLIAAISTVATIRVSPVKTALRPRIASPPRSPHSCA